MHDTHATQPVLTTGEALDAAKAVMVMIHGRGASAESILSLVPEIHQAGFAYFAPQAANGTWYPNRFLAPLESNEPYLSDALTTIGRLLDTIRQAGIPDSKIMLLGFSQGACLTLEYAARNARRYGGLVGLSGGLIGPDDLPREYPGSLADTPVFLGCSDVDFHVPKARVDLSAEVLKRLGAKVTERLYPNMGHMVNEDEVKFVHDMMTGVVK